jgi:hypothetical protein
MTILHFFVMSIFPFIITDIRQGSLRTSVHFHFSLLFFRLSLRKNNIIRNTRLHQLLYSYCDVIFLFPNFIHQSIRMTTPLMTPLDEIRGEIAATKAKLKLAEEENNTPMISIWAALLTKQQDKENILLAARSKCSCMIDKQDAATHQQGIHSVK